MSDLVTIDTANYAAMAKAMGIAGEKTSTDKKSNTLPRLKINHSPIMGEAEVQGKSMNVEVVQGGTYKLDIPEDKAVYSTSATMRPFLQRFMYKRFVKNLIVASHQDIYRTLNLYLKRHRNLLSK